jgi:hypothetical protein
MSFHLMLRQNVTLTTTFFFNLTVLAVHDCFKHAAGQDIFLLDWRQVL